MKPEASIGGAAIAVSMLNLLAINRLHNLPLRLSF